MEDSILIQRLISGDRDAFNRIYEKYSVPMYRTAYLICQNESDAEDALQETFVTLYQKARQIKKPDSLKWWLIKCVTGKTRDILRRKKHEYPDESVMELYDRQAQSEQELDRDDFLHYLSHLKPQQREVLTLYYYNELSVREIARITGQLEGTVKSRLYYARKRLKDQMEGGATCESDMTILISK